MTMTMTMPNSRQKPRRALMRLVRAVHPQRARAVQPLQRPKVDRQRGNERRGARLTTGSDKLDQPGRVTQNNDFGYTAASHHDRV